MNGRKSGKNRRVYSFGHNTVRPGTQNALDVPRTRSWSPETADPPPQATTGERRALPRYYDPALSEMRK